MSDFCTKDSDINKKVQCNFNNLSIIRYVEENKENKILKSEELVNFKEYQLVQTTKIFDKKGDDFYNGGGIIKYKEEIIFYEDTLEPGDLAIYNGRTEHGVYNIDQNEILDLNEFNGRSSVLVSLFKTP